MGETLSFLINEQIENDEHRWMRSGEFLHATCRGMKTQLQFIKREGAANRNYQFAVEDELLCFQFRDRRDDIRKISRERLAGF